MDMSDVNDLLCFFGMHKWRDSFYKKGRNCALGKRCDRCKTWHKTAKKWREKPLSVAEQRRKSRAVSRAG